MLWGGFNRYSGNESCKAQQIQVISSDSNNAGTYPSNLPASRLAFQSQSRPTCHRDQLAGLPQQKGRDKLGGAKISIVHGQSAAIVTLFPGANATLGLCVLSEDEAERDVQAAHRKEEKRRDKREFANVV